MLVVRATGITPFSPLPPSWRILPFHAVGKLTWKLMFGACGSTGAIAPFTLQYSGTASTTCPLFTCSGEAATSVAAVTVAPDVARPIEDAGMVCPLRAVQEM